MAKKIDSSLKNDLLPKQYEMIATLISNGGDKTAASKTLDIPRSTLYKWLSDEKFVSEYRSACDKIYTEHLATAISGIVDIATNGAGRDKIAACRTLLELNGYLTTKIDSVQNTKQEIIVSLQNNDNSTKDS